MNLRSKLIFIIASFLVLQGIIFFGYYSLVLAPKVQNLERVEAEKNTLRAKTALLEQLEELENINALWTHEKGLQFILENGQYQQIPLLFSSSRVREKNLHLFYVLSSNFETIYSLTYDPNTYQPFPMIAFPKQLIDVNPNYFHQKNPSQSLTGLFISDRGPMFITIKPWQNPRTNQVTWLVMGRYLTQAIVDKLNQSMRLDLQVYPLGVKALPEYVDKLLPQIFNNPERMHIEDSQTHMKSYAYLQDLKGNPSVVIANLRAKATTELIAQSMQQTYGILLAVNFLLVFFMFRLIAAAFVKPADKITDFISQVSANIDAPPRMRYEQNDELGLLSHELNEMILQFCSHNNKSVSKAFRAGSDRVRLEITQDIMSHLNQAIPLIENLETRLWSMSLNALEKLRAELECSPNQAIDPSKVLEALELNNTYLQHEIQDHRKQVSKIKHSILRTATILRGHSIALNQAKSFIPASRYRPKTSRR